ncbi:MAG: hypothetical protein PHI18_04955 [bacterium]|nr:hypothetical protein [bacterium]
MKLIGFSLLLVVSLFPCGFAHSPSEDSAAVSVAGLTADERQFAPDTAQNDLQSGLTSFGYATARAFGGVWHYLWKQAQTALERVGRFLEKILGDEETSEKNLLRLPFSKRK